MSKSKLSSGQIHSFNRDGYIIIRDFCNGKEVERLYQTALKDATGISHTGAFNNMHEQQSKQLSWYNPADNVFGYLSRSEKVIHPIAQLLDSDSPVCHIKSNLIQKEPNIGGVWQWHQDYCYWNQKNFMSPDQLVSVMVALTDINRNNGCSQLIKGSHKLGRISHDFEGEHVGADREVVHTSLLQMELVYAELSAGDAIFFHSNLLHRSDANLSAHSLWSVVSCYSSRTNVPGGETFQSWKVPVKMVPDAAIMEWETDASPKVSYFNEARTDTLNRINVSSVLDVQLPAGVNGRQYFSES